MNNIKRLIFVYLFPVMVYKLILDLFYVVFLNKYYAYSGFILNPSITKILISYVSLIAVTTILYIIFDEKVYPSKFILFFLFFNLVIPMSVLYALADKAGLIYFMCTFCLILISTGLMFTKKIHLPSVKNGQLIIFFLYGVISLYVYSHLILTGGIGRLNFDINLVYDTRNQLSNTKNILFSYLYIWQAYVVNMTLLSIFIFRRKYIFAIITVLLQLFLFGMTGHKSFLFSPILVISLSLFLKRKKIERNSFLYFISGYIIINLFSYLFYKSTTDITLLSLFFRRLLMVPSSLHFTYYDFFSSMPKMHLSHSFFSSFSTNPYGLGPVGVIAKNVFGKDFSPNVGFWGDAYANFGLPGMLFYSMVFLIILILLDSISLKVPYYYVIPIIFLPMMSIISSALPTSLLTHGILFSLLSLWLISNVFIEKNTEAKGGE